MPEDELSVEDDRYEATEGGRPARTGSRSRSRQESDESDAAEEWTEVLNAAVETARGHAGRRSEDVDDDERGPFQLVESREARRGRSRAARRQESRAEAFTEAELELARRNRITNEQIGQLRELVRK